MDNKVWNWKMRCIKNKDRQWAFIEGKTYKVKNEWFKNENGYGFYAINFEKWCEYSLNEWNGDVEWELIKDNKIKKKRKKKIKELEDRIIRLENKINIKKKRGKKWINTQ